MNTSYKQKAVNAVLWSTIERFSVQGINFVLGLLIARLVAPSDFGVIAMLAVFLAMANTFVDSGFANALIRKLDRTEIDNSTVFYFNIVVGAGAYVILFFAAPLIAEFYRMPILIPILRVVSWSIVFNSLAIVQQAILTSNINFKSQAKISVVAAVVSGFIGVVMAYMQYGVWALVAQMVSSAFVRMTMLWIVVRWCPCRAFSRQSFRELFSYGSKLLLSNLVVNISSSVTGLIIGRKFSSASLGFYNRAEQLSVFLAGNISAILNRVTFPVFSKKQNDKATLRQYYLKIISVTSMLVVPAMAILFVFAEPLIVVLLTEKWIPAVPLVRILVFFAVWMPFSVLNINILCVVGRSDYVLRIEMLKGALCVAAILLAIPYGLEYVCYALAIATFICSFVYTKYTKSSIDVSWSCQMRQIIPYVAMSAVAGAIGFFTTARIDSLTLRLIIAVMVFLIVYVTLLLIIDKENVRFLKTLIPKHRKND